MQVYMEVTVTYTSTILWRLQEKDKKLRQVKEAINNAMQIACQKTPQEAAGLTWLKDNKIKSFNYDRNTGWLANETDVWSAWIWKW